jgi:hypothetical protein
MQLCIDGARLDQIRRFASEKPDPDDGSGRPTEGGDLVLFAWHRAWIMTATTKHGEIEEKETG